ncbi:MAG TPA: TolC family protein [Gemmataceae bacterium]|nr:TolC family protein [Gemmataceae bacterium]
MECPRNGSMKPRIAALVLLSVCGCATPPGRDRGDVSRLVATRTGYTVGACPAPNQLLIPPGLELGQPLTEDHAVLLALWNNPLFQESLAELALTRADLVQAGLLPNPEFVYYFGVADKPLKYLIEFPIEALWMRPLRLKAAAAENERASERLTQLALDLIRDTRQAYADLILARDRVTLAAASVKLRGRVAEVGEARLKAGDASEIEVTTARIDSLQAQQDAARVAGDVPFAEERLKNLTGLSGFTGPLALDPAGADDNPEFAVEEVVRDAISTRPDALAAAYAVKAADERVRVARLGWVRFLGILDATSGQRAGHELGPAARFTIPIFNRNQGGLARTEAERDQLVRRQVTVRNQIVQDVRQAHVRYRQGRAELDILRQKVRPEVENGVRRARAAYETGNAPFLLVLETNRQLLGTFDREAQLHADLRRAWAELERAVGRRLAPPKEPAR